MGCIRFLLASSLTQMIFSSVSLIINPPKTNQNIFSATIFCSLEDSEIILSSEPLGLIGTLVNQVKKAKFEITDLRFLYKGTYKITAKSNPLNSSFSSFSSEIITVLEAEKNILIDFPEEVMMNTTHSLKISIKDQFKNNWVDNVSINLSYKQVNFDIIIVNGLLQEYLIFDQIGFVTIEVKDKDSGVMSQKFVRVNEKRLEIYSEFNHIKINSSLPITVKVDTGNEDVVEVTLMLSCLENCFGVALRKYEMGPYLDKLIEKGSGVVIFKDFF